MTTRPFCYQIVRWLRVKGTLRAETGATWPQTRSTRLALAWKWSDARSDVECTDASRAKIEPQIWLMIVGGDKLCMWCAALATHYKNSKNTIIRANFFPSSLCNLSYFLKLVDVKNQYVWTQPYLVCALVCVQLAISALHYKRITSPVSFALHLITVSRSDSWGLLIKHRPGNRRASDDWSLRALE